MIDPADHLGLVHTIAASRFGHQTVVEYEELVGDGMVALVEAARRFDPSKGAKFTTYAYRRVYGAMLDCCRHRNPLGNRRPNGNPDHEHLPMPAPIFNWASDDSDEEAFEIELAVYDDPGRRLIEADEVAELNDRIAGLTPRHNEVVRMRLAGNTRSEIAAELGVTASMVSRHLTAIRPQLCP